MQKTMNDQNSTLSTDSDTEKKSDPILEIHLGRPEEGDCPTLLLDGVSLHDAQQPYREILHLEGAEPEIVVIFGFGLGYLAAGMQKLAPQARIICWEPIEAMHDLALEVLEKEWELSDEVLVEKDLEDFQARLLAALPNARSLAVLGLDALAKNYPELYARFDQVVRDVIDASTLESMPIPLNADMRNFLTAALPRLTSEPTLASLAGSTPNAHWVLLTNAPDPGLAASIRAQRDALMIATIPEVTPTLTRYGLDADLVLVHRAMPPTKHVAGEVGGAVLAITPDSHPQWWEVPARARFSVGHTATSWLMPNGDPSCGISFAWGDAIPLAVLCSLLGASSLMPADPEISSEGCWNRLAPSARFETLLARCAARSGAEIIEIGRGHEQIPSLARDPRPPLREIVTGKGRPLQAEELAAQTARARRSLALLILEANRERLPEPLAGDYIHRRARLDAFTRALLSRPRAHYDSERMMLEMRGGQLWLESLDEFLPRAATPGAMMSGAILTETANEPIRVFLGGRTKDFIPLRVLESELRARCSRSLEIVHLADCVPADLPHERWLLEIPRLCGYRGHAIYLDASVLVLADVADLWDHPLGENVALRPAEGAASIVLIDCARFGRSEDGSFGALPESWDARDHLSSDSRALRYTCRPWHPWLSDLHPLAWAWEHALASTCHRRALSPQDLSAAAERGEIRKSLAKRYGGDTLDAATEKQPSDRSDGCALPAK